MTLDETRQGRAAGPDPFDPCLGFGYGKFMHRALMDYFAASSRAAGRERTK